MSYINIEKIELIKYGEDIFGVRVNDELIVNMQNPEEYVSEQEDVIQRGIAPQGHAQKVYDAMKAKKMRQDTIQGCVSPQVIRTHTE